MSDAPIDLELLYRVALASIHRACVFIRFGVQGVAVGDFEDTRLPGRNQILSLLLLGGGGMVSWTPKEK